MLHRTMKKQEYLTYFNNNQQRILPHQQNKEPSFRPKTSHYCLSKTKKMLPHIIEEYQYRITNQLLAEKIAHPRRDKLITGSFSNHQDLQNRSERRKMMTPNLRLQGKENQDEGSVRCEEGGILQERTNHERKRLKMDRLHKTLVKQGSLKQNNDYLISLQNSRMGKRILNTGSTVKQMLTKTYFTYKIYNGNIMNRDRYLPIKHKSTRLHRSNKQLKKFNNSIKYYFDKTLTEDGKDGTRSPTKRSDYNHFGQNNCSSPQLTSKNRTIHQCPLEDEGLDHRWHDVSDPSSLETYGDGELNFVISQLFVDSNPPLKPDASLIIQLIEKDEKLTRILSHYYAEKNNFVKQACTTQSQDRLSHRHCFTTNCFPYQKISSQKGSFAIRFRLHFHRHIFLRLLRADGLQQREIGVVGVDLQPFKTRVAKDYPFQIIHQVRDINGATYSRDLFQSAFEGKMYRFKKGEISTTLRFSYKLYHRSFKPLHPKGYSAVSTPLQ